ncbi:MAG TPA: endonuclease/exonuclease/phosphatase family protein [Longimicrobiales bacterium]|nr:endonuclease/exonuclease/phosphatase family protein [Longimicrobiales bacterium]
MLLHLILGFWLGIYACRTYVPAAVWNLSDAAPLYLKGGIAIGIHLVGVVGGAMPFMRRRRSAHAVAIAFAVVTVLRQVLLGTDVPGAVLSLVSWVLWLWWLGSVSSRAGDEVAPAFAIGFALQMVTQQLWHGLDLPMARGPFAIAFAAVLTVAFALTARNTRDESESNLAFISVGAAFFLEITLLANHGRIALLDTTGKLIVALGQFAVVFLLYLATRKHVRRTSLAFVVGAVVWFALLFGFYNQYEWPLLWVFAAVIIVACAMPGITQPKPIPVRAFLIGRFALPLAVLVIPMHRYSPMHVHGHDRHAAHESGKVRIATYNIHQGFDAYGAPAMQNIVDEIKTLDADVIALQEVNRGWTFVGGADLVAYLKFKFPEYAIHFVPINGQLWGVALMSRLTMNNLGGQRFTAPKGVFGYGYASAFIANGNDTIRVLGLHLTAGLEGNGDHSREDQTSELLHAGILQNGNVVVMGDFNSHPEDPPIRDMRAGFRDLGAEAGLAAHATWPASKPVERIEYIFARGEFKTTNGRIPATLASDHLPVFVDVELRPRRTARGHHPVNPK